MKQVTLDLEANDDDGFSMRRLAQILKRLGRDYGWRCLSIRPAANAKAHHGTDATQSTSDGTDAPECEPCGKVRVY